jgi:type VI secretion system protein
MGRGLLSRIETSSRSGAREREDLPEAIAAHLRVLLNTRQGDAATAPSFGLVDFTDLVHSFPGSISTLQAAIRASILEFEPRLKNVNVRYMQETDPLILKFEITAQPVEEGARGLLRFRTQVAPGGKVQVW